MTERRVAEEQRRKDDRGVCPLHDLIQKETDDHRDLVCGKIAQKADNSELRGLFKLVSVLVGICCLVVGGGFYWLRSDIDTGFSTVHRRITETQIKIDQNAKERIENDNIQIQQASKLIGQMETINWRLSQLEEANKQIMKK
jgi:hypothetical protein